MKAAYKHRITLKDFRGPQVWFGIVLALAGYLAQEWPIGDINFGPMIFLGGFLLGMGVMINRHEQDAVAEESPEG